jgi:serine/threonine protein kinase
MSTREALQKLFRYDDLSARPIRGGCGQVWRAHDQLFNRAVAIKTIDENLIRDSSVKARRSFIKEAQAGARLGQFSRNIVQVLDLGFAIATPYFTMEWIDPREGRSEIDISGDLGTVSLAEAKAIMFDVCQAVRVAHRNHIVHSDIAPGTLCTTRAFDSIN